MAVLTTEGKVWIAQKISNLAPLSNAVCDYAVWGTGATAEAVGVTLANVDVSVATEARVQGTLTNVTTTLTNDTSRLVSTITAAGSRNITQVERTNNSSGTTASTHVPLVYALFTSIPMLVNDRIEFTLDVKVA